MISKSSDLWIPSRYLMDIEVEFMRLDGQIIFDLK